MKNIIVNIKSLVYDFLLISGLDYLKKVNIIKNKKRRWDCFRLNVFKKI